jgi:hypothetical protein
MCNINEQKKAFEILHGQICNGGFQQWLMNGYGELAETTITALESIDTANALSVAGMVEKLVSKIDINGGDEDYIFEPEFAELADQLDGQYYKICNVLREEAKAYFESDTIEDIARKELLIETLEVQGLDDLDFHECSVIGIKAALTAAYEAGKQAKAGDTK